MSEPQLILTGGTLSSSRNTEGLLEPSGESLDTFATEIGFKQSVKPYIIDSIDFDIGTHYPKLLAATMQTLDAGNTPVICGGTDSLTWYSTLLTKDLMRRGYLQDGSDQKVVFLSSMKSIEDAPQLVRGILTAGKVVAEQKGLNGGFALSAMGLGGERIEVHNVLNHFDKVSARLINALRSYLPVETVIRGHINTCEGYAAPKTDIPTTNTQYARIAPPLLRGHDSEAVLAYLQLISNAKPPFDGILLEGLPERLHRNHRLPIIDMVNRLHNAGTKVVFCNPMRFDDAKGMQPVIANGWGHGDGSFEYELTQAGAKFVTGLPKDVYLDMMLSTPPEQATALSPESVAHPVRQNQKVIGIRYVPNSTIMSEAVRLLTPRDPNVDYSATKRERRIAARAHISGTDHRANPIVIRAKNIVFSALPGSAMPDSMLPALEDRKDLARFWSVFEYNGNRYVNFRGDEFVEAPEAHHYVAGQRARDLVTPYASVGNPVTEMFHAHGLVTSRNNGNGPQL